MIGLVLVITDNAAEARQLTRACDALGVGIHVVGTCDAAMTYLNSGSAELIVGHFEAILEMRQLRPGLHTIVLASASDSGQIIESIKRGVLDVLTRPMNHDVLVKRLGDALKLAEEALQPPLERRKKGTGSGVRVVGQSPAMQDVYRQIGMIAPREINVLITGESGTGKELVAKAIVEHSARSDKPFMAINCAAIPDQLLESELFGHEKGSFTGADKRRVGKFEQCDGGTLFLDEIGDLPLLTQAKLLRVLQDHSFQRVGGNQTFKSDVRIIAATHQSLEEMIAKKQFRQDLYYRLKVATIHLPALREREVDAVLLAHYFMDRIGRQMKSEVRAFAPETVAALVAYPWPGNVRELENVIRSALAMARGTVLRREFLPERITGAGIAEPLSAVTEGRPEDEALGTWIEGLLKRGRAGNAYDKAVGQVERVLIYKTLSQTQGHLVQAAELLGISRTTLRKKMREHKISVKAGPAQG